MNKPLNALDALKLARETGVKVAPATWNAGWYYATWKNEKVVLFYGKYRASERGLSLDDLVNDDGSPVEWHVVPEPGTERKEG